MTDKSLKIININDIYIKIIRNHILDLLKVINSKYPDKFLTNAINIELDYIIIIFIK